MKTGQLILEPDVGAGPVVVDRWLFATSVSNLFYMLASGLFLSPAGFRGRYYQDALALYPGWIPLFPNVVPKAALSLAVSEHPRLRPCVVELDLRSLQGPCVAIAPSGDLREIVYPTGLANPNEVLLVPAPLPISWIKQVIFPTKEDKTLALAEAKDFANVSLTGFPTKEEKRLFGGAPEGGWRLTEAGPPSQDQGPAVPMAVGGVLAMLFHLGNRGDLAATVSRIAFDGTGEDVSAIVDPVLRGVPEWLRSGCAPETSDVSAGLYWRLVDELAQSKYKEPRLDGRDLVLSRLTIAAAEMVERRREALLRLADDLRGIGAFGGSTLTELLERHEKPFSAAMTLFFLCDSCAEFLELSHPRMREEVMLLAGILFGANGGWEELPRALREPVVQPRSASRSRKQPSAPRESSGLSAVVCHRMAALAQERSGSGLNLGPVPPRPRTLRELLSAGEEGWTKRQKEAALAIARASGWGCVSTRFSLGKGEYQMIVDGKGTHIVFQGEPRSVVTEVDRQEMLARLAEARGAVAGEPEARALLEG